MGTLPKSHSLAALLLFGLACAPLAAQDAPFRMPAIDATNPAATYPSDIRYGSSQPTGFSAPLPPVSAGLPDWSPPPPLDGPAPPGYVLPPAPVGANTYITSPTDPNSPLIPPAPGTLHLSEPSPSDGRPGVPPGHPIDFKPGSWFQRLTLMTSWMERGGGPDAVGVVDGEITMTIALPFPTSDFPLLITPGFAAHAWDGPIANEMPPRTYDAYADFSWVVRYFENWTVVVGVKPGYFGDFHNTTSDGLRILGKGIVKWDWYPDRLSLVAGLYYLDRPDYPYLPIGGVIYCPNDDWRFEILFPQPKAAYRLSWDGRQEDWVYVMGQFGGDSWAIQRRSDLSFDRAAYRDWRLILGVERKLPGGANRYFEVAWLFNRHIEYDSGSPTVDPGDTLMLRAGLAF